MHLREETEVYALLIKVFSWRLHWQVSFVAQFFNYLDQISSTVEHLNLVSHWPYQEHSGFGHHTDWPELFRLFSNVKTLCIDDGLVKELSCCLLDDGEHPMELFPELQELTYSGSGDIGDAFTSFIDARRNAGCPVTLVLQYTITPLS